ncbi:MAG: protein phosphatase 2C domain-containing protein [Treponema sp.]|jgi:hypothetical protein|nr:protein phosphatase 2C domain-containing protein [Treponema sp.]
MMNGKGQAYKAFAGSTIGASHLKEGTACQDYSLAFTDGLMAVAVLADGHGGADYFRSDRGSRFAVESALEGIREFIRIRGEIQTAPPEQTEYEHLLRHLVKNILASWYGKVEADYTRDPPKPEEMEKVSEKKKQRYQDKDALYLHHAYGTTLIAVAISADYWFGLHIGDGKCVALYPDGSFQQPIPWDKRCFLNITTSLCDDDAAETCRIYFGLEKPVAVFIGSDGVDDSYPFNENEQYLYHLYQTIALTFADEGFETAYQHVQDFLPALTGKGSGDDLSIAGFLDMNALEETARIQRSPPDDRDTFVSGT